MFLILPLWHYVKTNNPKIKNSKSFFVNENKHKSNIAYLDWLFLFNSVQWRRMTDSLFSVQDSFFKYDISLTPS